MLEAVCHFISLATASGSFIFPLQSLGPNRFPCGFWTRRVYPSWSLGGSLVVVLFVAVLCEGAFRLFGLSGAQEAVCRVQV